MRYHFFQQQREFWCLAACLQSILKLRRFQEPSQSEIAKELEIGDKGVEALDLEYHLNRFLKKHGAKCRHDNPFISEMPLDITLSSELNAYTDVLAAYDYPKLHRSESGCEKHFSIITQYNLARDSVILMDPAWNKEIGFFARDRDKGSVRVGLNELTNSMQAREDERYGLYIVEAWT